MREIAHVKFIVFVVEKSNKTILKSCGEGSGDGDQSNFCKFLISIAQFASMPLTIVCYNSDSQLLDLRRYLCTELLLLFLLFSSRSFLLTQFKRVGVGEFPGPGRCYSHCAHHWFCQHHPLIVIRSPCPTWF